MYGRDTIELHITLTWWSHHGLLVPPWTFLTMDTDTVFQALYSCAWLKVIVLCGKSVWTPSLCTLSINHYENVLNKIHILFIILFFFSVPPNYIGVVVNQQVYADAPFSLALNLEASPPVHNFTWTRNGMVLNGNIINGNLTANSISISLIRPSDAGIYSVVAINILGSDTASFNLSVLCKLFGLFWCLYIIITF